MDTIKINWKTVVMFSGAICAYLIGAGFATGQEVLQFFTTSGSKGFIAAAFFLVAMGVPSTLLLSIGQKMHFKNPYDVFEYYCGKILGSVYAWFYVIVIFGVLICMLAGGGSTLHEQFSFIPKEAGVTAIALLALGTAVLGMDKLIKIIGILGPIKIIFMAILGVAALFIFIDNPAILGENAAKIPALVANETFNVASPNWAWSGVLYSFLSLFVCVPFLVACGTSFKTLKDARYTGIISTVVFTIAVFLLLLSEIVYIDSISDKAVTVPTVAIAREVSPIMATIFSILIAMAIYSAVASLLLIVVRKFAVDKTKKFNLIATGVIVFAAVVGSLISFDELVNALYTSSAYASILFVILVVYKEFAKGKQNQESRIENQEPANLKKAA